MLLAAQAIVLAAILYMIVGATVAGSFVLFGTRRSMPLNLSPTNSPERQNINLSGARFR